MILEQVTNGLAVRMAVLWLMLGRSAARCNVRKWSEAQSMSRTLIQGGRVIDPSQQLDRVTNVLVEDGRIAGSTCPSTARTS